MSVSNKLPPVIPSKNTLTDCVISHKQLWETSQLPNIKPDLCIELAPGTESPFV